MDRSSNILDIAERRMRQTGYHAVSFRDIAAEIGIKSASLHYHFPKKEDLGMALVRRYSENFHAALTLKTQEAKTPHEDLAAFIDIYCIELKERQLVCLCAVLGAEASGLPDRVTSEVKGFFDTNIDWLEARYTALGSQDPSCDAKVTLSLLEGAMIVSAVNDDNTVFDAAVRSVMQNPLLAQSSSQGSNIGVA